MSVTLVCELHKGTEKLFIHAYKRLHGDYRREAHCCTFESWFSMICQVWLSLFKDVWTKDFQVQWDYDFNCFLNKWAQFNQFLLRKNLIFLKIKSGEFWTKSLIWFNQKSRNKSSVSYFFLNCFILHITMTLYHPKWLSRVMFNDAW